MLQIYSIEKASENSAVCDVRCVGGVVRLGDTFTTSRPPEGTPAKQLRIEKIERYREVFVEFFDPPHAARVHFSGPGGRSLERGDILIAVETAPGKPVNP